jgi:hypothetical protein
LSSTFPLSPGGIHESSLSSAAFAVIVVCFWLVSLQLQYVMFCLVFFGLLRQISLIVAPRCWSPLATTILNLLSYLGVFPDLKDTSSLSVLISLSQRIFEGRLLQSDLYYLQLQPLIQ